MATTQLDRIVKGAPAPNVSPEQVANAARPPSRSGLSPSSPSAPQALALDPVSHLPSSPPQIYLNLLILEASLRAQYLSLRARLRLHMLLLGALLLWTSVFIHLNFFKLREDGNGQGGSVYWVVDTAEKMGLVGGMITWALVWVTGLYDRGVRWPRRWVNVTNRGLRGFNMKVVVIRGSFWKELVGYLSLLDPFGYWAGTKGIKYQALPRDLERMAGGEKEKLRRLEDSHRATWIEEDVASGGDTISLLLLPKPFSADFREDWDTWRIAYWEKENERRAGLRALLKAKERQVARREGGWIWWTGWRGWRRLIGRPRTVPETSKKAGPRSRPSSMVLKERRRDLVGGVGGDGHSRSSSRSTTPSGDLDVRHTRRLSAIEPGGGTRSVRTSSTTGTGTGRRKRTPSQLNASRPSSRIFTEGRPVTPDGASALSPAFGKRFSTLSSGSASASEFDGSRRDDVHEVEIKEEKG